MHILCFTILTCSRTHLHAIKPLYFVCVHRSYCKVWMFKHTAFSVFEKKDCCFFYVGQISWDVVGISKMFPRKFLTFYCFQKSFVFFWLNKCLCRFQMKLGNTKIIHLKAQKLSTPGPNKLTDILSTPRKRKTHCFALYAVYVRACTKHPCF